MTDPWPDMSPTIGLLIRLRQLMDAVETGEAEKADGAAETFRFSMDTRGSNAWVYLSEAAARRLTAMFTEWLVEFIDECQAKKDPAAAFMRAVPVDIQKCNPN
ncbi:hypothetical protein [Streptomyces sp. NPDC051173]|uniref:hypothetical protein n=1 Tax=Streptomyces sp. NPDC051173 TaxID=3155164 RepID=UPI00344EF38D